MAHPNFFIVGAPKCGTTSLSEYLRTHPRIFMSRPKEPQFFSTDLYVRNPEGIDSLSSYLHLFDKATQDHSVVGEASATYMYSSHAIPSIRRFDPDAKILALLRNPVEAVFSLHSQYLFDMMETETDFERAWMLQQLRRAGREIPERCNAPLLLQYRRVGAFSEQIGRIYKHFPKSQVMILLLDDLKLNPSVVYQQIMRFLGIPNDHRAEFPVLNARKELRYRWIRRFDQMVPSWGKNHVRAFKRFLGLDDRILLAPIYTRPWSRPGMSAAIRGWLIDEFRPEIARLASLIERDLDSWLSPRADSR